MTGLLLDTNVISELRKHTPNQGFRRWWATVDESDLFISTLTLGELTHGIERLRLRDPQRAESLEMWAKQLSEGFARQLLPVDDRVAVCWGQIAADRTRPVVDTLLAATAIVHDFTLVTRNIRDFESLPLRVVNPFNENR